MNILMVDDNLLMQQVIQRYLGTLGYQVDVAGSANEALALARRQRPGLLMIDLYLPDADGAEALQQLRALPGYAATPAIAISGLCREDAPLEGAGFNEFLPKPVELDDLAAVVRRYLPHAI